MAVIVAYGVRDDGVREVLGLARGLGEAQGAPRPPPTGWTSG
jgi:hypothetical protein